MNYNFVFHKTHACMMKWLREENKWNDWDITITLWNISEIKNS